MYNANNEMDCTTNANLIKFISTCKVINGTPVNSVNVTVDYQHHQQDSQLLTNLNDNSLICDFAGGLSQHNENISASASSCSDTSFHTNLMPATTQTSASKSNTAQSNKKFNKKKTQVTNEVDEERTSQMVLEILKNIKEKTKELENMNQTGKSNKTIQSSTNTSHQNFYGFADSPPSPTSQPMMLANPSPPPPVPHTHQPTAHSLKKVKRLVGKSFHAPKINSNILTSANKHTNNIKSNEKATNGAQSAFVVNSNYNSSGNEVTCVPYGWKRAIDENGLVFYASPSGVSLRTKKEIHAYLLSANTCKCGLSCPLDIDKTFSFDPKIDAKTASGLPTGQSGCCSHKPKLNGFEDAAGTVIKVVIVLRSWSILKNL
jgi:hypothetical protein